VAARSRWAIRSGLGRARVVTLLREMTKSNAEKGSATLRIGGGMGIAMCAERG
jgi:acetyl-CoA C-acetyltransferase